jgi:glucose-6-phosphate-specific signal transduction histidine kinase
MREMELESRGLSAISTGDEDRAAEGQRVTLLCGQGLNNDEAPRRNARPAAERALMLVIEDDGCGSAASRASWRAWMRRERAARVRSPAPTDARRVSLPLRSHHV